MHRNAYPCTQLSPRLGRSAAPKKKKNMSLHSNSWSKRPRVKPPIPRVRPFTKKHAPPPAAPRAPAKLTPSYFSSFHPSSPACRCSWGPCTPCNCPTRGPNGVNPQPLPGPTDPLMPQCAHRFCKVPVSSSRGPRLPHDMPHAACPCQPAPARPAERPKPQPS